LISRPSGRWMAKSIHSGLLLNITVALSEGF
jgi:hypothetical protein